MADVDEPPRPHLALHVVDDQLSAPLETAYREPRCTVEVKAGGHLH
jgi:hypothetical protein